MIILLSPAKSLDFDSPVPIESSSDIKFPDHSKYLANKLKKLSANKLKSMMNISDDLARLNAERYDLWSYPFDSNSSRQAIYAFDGDVYKGFDAYSLSKKEMDEAQKKIRILSGLYGMLRPLDLIQPYRLEMGTSWAVTPKKKNLYVFWRKVLTESLREEMIGSNTSFILNLASQEYAKVIDVKSLSLSVISPTFKEERGDKYQMISFFAKKARGLLARFVIRNQIKTPEELQAFDVEGYHFNNSLSDISKNKWVFTR